MKNETNDRVKRGHRTVRSTLTSLVALGATSVLLVGGLTLISASGASAATSSATSSAQCNATVTAGTGELVGALIAGVTAGTTKVTFDCNNAATPAIAAEVPLLAKQHRHGLPRRHRRSVRAGRLHGARRVQRHRHERRVPAHPGPDQRRALRVRAGRSDRRGRTNR